MALYQGACYWCLSSHCLLVQCRIRDTMSQKSYDPLNLLQCNYNLWTALLRIHFSRRDHTASYAVCPGLLHCPLEDGTAFYTPD